MIFSWKTMLAGLLVVGLIVAAKLAGYYHDQLTESEASLIKLNRELKLAKDDIADMTKRQRDVAVLDAKYTGELADAKKQLDNLQRCVSSGKCGLHINVRRPANGETCSSGMGDASSPRLTDAAERNYFTIRERIETVTRQVNYLQDYIRSQCLR